MAIILSIDWTIIQQCDSDTRVSVLPFVESCVELSGICRDMGIQPLIDYAADEEKEAFFRIAAGIITGSYSPDMVRFILENLLSAEKVPPRQYLERVIFACCVTLIQRNTPQRSYVRTVLRSILGSKFVLPLEMV